MPETSYSEADLLISGKGGYPMYRIPALVAVGDGVVLLFAEARKNNAAFSDFSEMHMLQMRSTDGGRTWDPPRIIWREAGDCISITGPCPVYDAQTRTVHLAFTRNCQEVFVMTSRDRGQSWDTPREITASAYQPDWNRYWTGPGHGLQLARGAHQGRLVMPAYHLEGPTDGRSMRSHMLLSDDHGQTWRTGQSTTLGASYDGRSTRYAHQAWLPAGCQWHGCESMAVETTVGDLFLVVRNQAPDGRKAFGWSRDGGESWSALERHATLPDVQCQSSIVRCDALNGEGGPVYLFAGPAPTSITSRERVRLTIHVSSDECRTWRAVKVIAPGPAAYSDLCVTDDGSILCAYEGGRKQPHEAIRLARFDLSWLLTGASNFDH